MKYLSIQTFQCGISVSGLATFTGGAEINILSLNGATTSSEASLFLGAHSSLEGGQLVLQKGTGQTYAAHLDNYSDQFRVLFGTNTGSAGVAMSINLATRQLTLPTYTSTSSFPGTVAGYLAFDSVGNIITTSLALSGYVPTSRTLTINGTSYDLSADRTWTINTVDYTSRLQHQVKAGVAINKGQAVYVTSADGTNMIVGLASNASEATSSKTMGLLDATVSTNGFANVVTEGLLAGLDTSTAGAEGDPVWLGTGGNLIYGLANKPYAPAHLVFIGIVTRKNANNGEIFIKVQNGFELEELHNVDLKTTTPVNGELLGFNGTLWVNKTIAGWLGYTPVSGTGTTNYLPKFTGSTSLGNSSFYDAGTPTIWVNSSNANSRFYFSPVHADGRINFNAVAGTNDYTLLRAWHTGNTVGIGNGSTFGSALSTYYDSVLIGTSGAIYFMNGTFGPLNVPYRLGISTSATATYFTSGVENNTTNLESNEFIYTAKAHTFRTGTTTGNQSQPNQYTPLFLSTAGNVGIGTTGLVPGYLLTINGGVSIAAGQSLSLDPSAGIYMVASSSQFRLYNNSIAALSVASTGNVLINTTTDSGYKLDVNGTARFSGNTYLAGDILVSNGGGTRYIQAPNGSIGFLSSNSSGYNLWTDNSKVGIKSELYINNDLNYNVGIRLRTSTTQTSPSGYGYELSFQPQVNHVPTHTAIRTLDSTYGGSTTTPSPIYIFGGQNTTSGSYADLILQSDFTTSRGNVGIGTISPSQKLHVAGNLRLTGALYDSNNQAGTAGQILKSTGTGTDWVSLSEITGVDGTGTANYLAKWSDADTISTGNVYDDGTSVFIGTTSSSAGSSAPLYIYKGPSFSASARAGITLHSGYSGNGNGSFLHLYNYIAHWGSGFQHYSAAGGAAQKMRFYVGYDLSIQQADPGNIMTLSYNGLGINTLANDVTANLELKGFGNSSGTKSLYIANSDNSRTLSYTDDGKLTLSNGTYTTKWYVGSGYSPTLEFSAQGNITWGNGAIFRFYSTGDTTDYRLENGTFHTNHSQARFYAGSSGYLGFETIGSTTAYDAIGAVFTDNNTVSLRFFYKNTGSDIEGMRLTSSGNFLVGTTTDSGYKLDVNGTAILRSGTLNLVGNYLGISGSCADVNIFNNCGSSGNVSFSLGGNKYLNIFQVVGSSSGYTSGTHNTISSSITYAWSSGTANSNLFVLSPTINNTGTYSGIFRGFYYNPTITSLTGTTHRAIETVTGDVIFGSTSGNVGIGTTSPGFKLDVSGTARVNQGGVNGSGQALIVAGSGDVQLTDGGSLFFGSYDYGGSTYIRAYDDSNIMYFYLNGTNMAYFRNDRAYFNANVGIGTSNPTHKLTVTGDGSGTMKVGSPGASGNYTGISLNGSLDISNYNILSSPTDNHLYINRPTGNNIYFRVNNNDQVIINSSGNVGIGTSNPASKLHVVGPINIERTGVANVYSTVDMEGNFRFNASVGYAHTFLNNGSELVRIMPSGNVGIGTTTPDSKLHIEGTTTGTGSGADAIVHIKQNGSWNGNEPWALYVEGYSYLNGFRINAADGQRGLYSDAGQLGFAVSGNSPISFTQNTSDYRMYIASGGNIGIGTTSPSEKLEVVGAIKAGIAGNSSANTPALRVTSAGQATTQAAIAIQQTYTEGDTIIFADYDQYVEWNFMHENAANQFIIHGGTSTNGLNTNTFYSPNGTAKTGYIKHVFDQTNGDFYVGGNVGIGTTSPATKLDVSGVITATGGNSTNWNTAYGWGNHASQSYATTSYVTTQINNLINGAPGALDTLSELASALGNDASFATTVTNSIASKLSLSGGTMTGQILFQTSALNNGFRWDVNSDAAGITFKNTGDGDNNSYFNFFTEDNGNEYFKFSHNTWNIGSFDFMDVKNGVVRTNGNIYVNASQSGTRSAGTNELINGNRVWHDGDFSSSNISNWNTAYGWGDHSSVGYALNSSLANYLPLSGGVIGGAVTINGNLTVNGTITENSSIKLKENIETSEGNLEKVVNLRPVTYNKIGSQTTELGLIAEEVAEVYPEFVQYDENGEPVGVHYSRLTAALIGAVKELNEQLQELKRNK